MIVRPSTGAVHLITQPDHAALARRIMEHWRPLGDEPRRDAILLAVGEHDAGWREPDADPRVDANGRVADFVHLDLDARQGVWPRGVARLRQEPWSAALVAHHAVTVYGRFRGHPAWAAFFRGMESARDRHVEEAGGTLNELNHEYRYLRIGDLISLAFCTRQQGEERFEEWSVRLVDGRRVVVSPYELDGPELDIAVDAVELRTTSFPSSDTLREAIGAAPRVRLEGVVGPAPAT